MVLPFALLAAQILTPLQERGKAVFQACSGCHNVLTDARKSGPSLRTLFGKVRLINGKRATEDNVAQLIMEGYNGMPAYRNMFRPEDWSALLAWLKTLRGRPEISPVLKPVRGSDSEVLAGGKQHYQEHCASCHETGDAPRLLGLFSRDSLSDGEPVRETTIIPRILQGHGGMPAKQDTLDDGLLFSLMAFLKASSPD